MVVAKHKVEETPELTKDQVLEEIKALDPETTLTKRYALESLVNALEELK